jgi:argininosuccinate lyase
VAFRKGRLEGEVPERVARYTSSLEEDAEILEEVLLVNAAHLRSLNRMGFLDDDALRKAMEALRSFPRDALRSADPRLEDVHIVVEEERRGLSGDQDEVEEVHSGDRPIRFNARRGSDL